ncbi:MAG: GNAT family N-acetyltransferase [Sandaracinaceae bacterium]|nr:GNAT family N-acetyltransferase [Sandaracinaceae bacterium]
MARTIEIRPLAKDDDRSRFSCGQPDLDRFFEHYAGQNQFTLRLAVTYVAVIEGGIVGFATVAASSIERAHVPSPRLRKRLPAYPLPVLRLARLGVDTRARGLGIGKALLRYTLALAVEQRDRTGGVGVVTDAKVGAVSFYRGLGFVPLEGVREGLLHGEPTPLFLPIDTIASASQR